MTSKRWQRPLLYWLMSAFIVWHSLAMVIGPAPKSYITDAARAAFRPYLELFGFNNPWDFYAPRIGYGHQFHYVIEDGEGKSHDFSPSDELSWFHPNFWWFRAWYETIGDFPALLGGLFVELVCKKHESLHPVSVTLMRLEQKPFTSADLLSGRQPLDREFVNEKNLGSGKCPGR